jgi:hypothetical protein
MKIQLVVEDLRPIQVEYLNKNLLTSYVISPETVRVCAVFVLADGAERHMEMPVVQADIMLTRLHQVGESANIAEAALTPDALADVSAPLGVHPDGYDPAFADRLENGAYGK